MRGNFATVGGNALILVMFVHAYCNHVEKCKLRYIYTSSTVLNTRDFKAMVEGNTSENHT